MPQLHHVNPYTGSEGTCKATKKCPFGPENHYKTKAEAVKASEDIIRKLKTNDTSNNLRKNDSIRLEDHVIPDGYQGKTVGEVRTELASKKNALDDEYGDLQDGIKDVQSDIDVRTHELNEQYPVDTDGLVRKSSRLAEVCNSRVRGLGDAVDNYMYEHRNDSDEQVAAKAREVYDDGELDGMDDNQASDYFKNDLNSISSLTRPIGIINDSESYDRVVKNMNTTVPELNRRLRKYKGRIDGVPDHINTVNLDDTFVEYQDHMKKMNRDAMRLDPQMDELTHKLNRMYRTQSSLDDERRDVDGFSRAMEYLPSMSRDNVDDATSDRLVKTAWMPSSGHDKVDPKWLEQSTVLDGDGKGHYLVGDINSRRVVIDDDCNQIADYYMKPVED